MKNILILFFLSIGSILAYAKINPQNDAIINYTQVMFEVDQIPTATSYTIYVMEKRTGIMVSTQTTKSLATMVYSNLHFGKKYTWYYKAFIQNKLLATSSTYNFSISNTNLVDSTQYKYNIPQNDKKYNQNNIFFIDYLGVAINRKGEAVWYMPRNADNIKFGDSSRRSLRVTESGTFTYLDNSNCYERALNGAVLWYAPKDGAVSGDKTEYYHHDFRKLPNSNYVACSYITSYEKNYFDTTKFWTVKYNTLIEYDSNKKVVWVWKEKDHVDATIIFENADVSIIDFPGTHLNGFDYDAKQDAFICSFRNTSRVFKIDHKTGDVQFELGRYNTKLPHLATDAYTLSNQHGPAWMPNGDILIYDNNFVPNADMVGITNPHIRIIAQPVATNQERQLWNYELVSDSFAKGQRGKEGVAFNMYNNNIVICQGSANRLLEVTRNKKIVWEAFCYEYIASDSIWVGFNNYRTYAATSLISTYFTLQYNYVQGKKSKQTFTLNNEGTDAKQFVINYYNGTQQIKTTNLPILVKANAAATLPVPKQCTAIQVFPLYASSSQRTIAF